jgi:uncharacterized membrane protein YagU involved in acid resistance
MSLFMQMAWLRLPAREMNPLPPRRITRRLLRVVGAEPLEDQSREISLTWLLHFLFGSAMGSLYSLVGEKLPGDASQKGLLAGTAVWSGSYLGWIPLTGLLPPATRHPWRMNVLMIVAHFIWGITMGWLARFLNPGDRYIDL